MAGGRLFAFFHKSGRCRRNKFTLFSFKFCLLQLRLLGLIPLGQIPVRADSCFATQTVRADSNRADSVGADSCFATQTVRADSVRADCVRADSCFSTQLLGQIPVRADSSFC